MVALTVVFTAEAVNFLNIFSNLPCRLIHQGSSPYPTRAIGLGSVRKATLAQRPWGPVLNGPARYVVGYSKSRIRCVTSAGSSARSSSLTVIGYRSMFGRPAR